MMLAELTLLLDWVTDPGASRHDYQQAIMVDNCLGKTSVSNRRLSAKHLIELYGLDPSLAIFRMMLFLWHRDKEARSQLALLCSYARDSLLHNLADRFVQLPAGTRITSQQTEEWIEALEPNRFNKATLRSTAQNINATWTQAGYLKGKVVKTRTIVPPSAGAVVYALFLAYLTGARGTELFQSSFVKLLDCNANEARQASMTASQRGWLHMKQITDVVDITFPGFLNPQEMELLREQN